MWFPHSPVPVSFQNCVQFHGRTATFVNTMNLMVRNCCPSPPANSVPPFVGCPLLIILSIHAPLQRTPVTNTNNQSNIQPVLLPINHLKSYYRPYRHLRINTKFNTNLAFKFLARPCTEHTLQFPFSLLCWIHCVVIKVSRDAVPVRK
jgi:hypothetical protein